MLLWFVALSVVGVWAVFRDPALDYRMVAVGSILADLAHLLGLPHLHSLVVWAVTLFVVMGATRHRRRLRRRLLAIPIGGFAHLVLDATWARATTFWWPFLGPHLPAGRLPSFERPALLVVVQEVLGLLAILWCWRRFGLRDRCRRREFLSHGRLMEAPSPAAGAG